MSTLMGLLSVQGQGRSRSKSPGGRERSRSRSNVREERPDPRKESDRRRSSKKYSESDSDSESAGGHRHKSSKHTSKRSSRQKSDSDSDSDGRTGRTRSSRSSYSSVRPNIVTASPASAAKPTPQGATKSSVQVQPSYGKVNAYSYAPPPGHVPQPPGAFPELPHGALSETRHMSYVGSDPRYAVPPNKYAPQPVHDPRQRAASNAGQQYANVGQFQYAQIDPKIAYKDPNSAINMYNQPPKPQIVSVDPRRSDSKLMDKHRPRESDKHYNEDKYLSREKESARYERKLETKAQEDDRAATARRLSRLSVGGVAGAATLGVAAAAGHGAANGGGKPPPSPLLEAYTGTYQSISPMPSALVLAGHKFDSDISDVDLDSDDSQLSDDPEAERRRKIKRLEKEKEWIQKKREKDDHSPKEYERRRPGPQLYETRAPEDDFGSSVTSSKGGRKKVSWYDAEGDAEVIASVLKGSKNPNVKPLIKILPHLGIEDLEALKVEYKNHATIGGQGINMSKHIKSRVTGHLGKAAYATSLGQYESDAYWANCFYQSGASRRELLIESLMGRTNQQIREIKNFFKDKKYDDDLEKCLKAELKADKFRSAILLALEERRQAESPILDSRLVRHDVQDLYEALNSAGGESAMIQIIVVRSDSHLREVLRQYEKVYGRNFARDMISKSRNLVVSGTPSPII